MALFPSLTGENIMRGTADAPARDASDDALRRERVDGNKTRATSVREDSTSPRERALAAAARSMICSDVNIVSSKGVSGRPSVL